MAGLHESAAGDIPIDRKLRDSEIFPSLYPLGGRQSFPLRPDQRNYNTHKQDCYTMASVSVIILVFLLNFHIANNITFRGSKF